MNDFANKKYGPAVRAFEDMGQQGFECDVLHYYIALCYDYLNQLQLARFHYNWVASHSLDRTLLSYSTVGCQKLAYLVDHRTYEGQGGDFARISVHAPDPPPKPPPIDWG